MKVCKSCGIEIDTRDGENRCQECEETRSKAKRERARLRRKERDDVMRSCGLQKVRGAMGGTYWE